VVQVNQLDKAGIEDRLDAIAEHRLLFLVIIGLPEVVLVLTDEVARLWEGWHPLASSASRLCLVAQGSTRRRLVARGSGFHPEGVTRQ
jgi:hypothetical protein